MGNNTSTGASASSGVNRRGSESIRKSTASANYSNLNGKDPFSDNRVRKSSAGKNTNSLDEEFSDLILQKVVQKPANANLVPPLQLQAQTPTQQQSSHAHNQFTNDLIEDEFNELNEGLVETDSTAVQRNIIPDNGFENDNSSSSETTPTTTNNSTTATDDMEIDEPFPQDDEGNSQRQNEEVAAEDEIMNNPTDRSNTPTPDLTKVDFTKITSQRPSSLLSESVSAPPPAQMLSAASVARNAHSPSPNLDSQKYLQQRPAKMMKTEHNNTPHHHSNHHHHHHHNNNANSHHHHRQKQQILIPIEIKWVNVTKEPIHKIAIIGSFSNWRDVIKMYPSMSHPNEFVTTIDLPLGVHKLLYIINNEYRVSDQLPTATDQEGIFFNWFEVIDDTHLFNHSMNQPNHIGASTDYDANIIRHDESAMAQSPQYQQQQQTGGFPTNIPPRQAGKYDVDRIHQKSNELLYKISKEGSSEFEHVEYIEDTEIEQQQPPPPVPQQNDIYGTSYENTQYQPFDLSSNNSNSFLAANANNEPAREYSSEIPEMFINYDYFKLKPSNYELPEPPQLPPHLNNVLLNKISSSSSGSSSGSVHAQIPSNIASAGAATGGTSSTSTSSIKRPPLRRADSSYYASSKESYHLQIPNHVILNHLMTTSIKNDVLTVACITRYLGKFVTQIMHSPADK
ncbi:hypothetical protein Cantr_09642 [Candida viswanathii]|uniref:Association with the SNF1 complex (ASC) domain-containing protein n=1 Tax=Candida viswanathii TaxID=5486 RepID=A0A367YBN7_9ASCO|nr:hypothetical protein Cantr_09642 [Candida viswanathii]